EIVGVSVRRLAFDSKRRNVIVRVAQRPLQPLELQALELVAARALDRFEIASGRTSSPRHGSLLSVTPVQRGVLPWLARALATRGPVADTRNTSRRTLRTTSRRPCS